ncbi:SDR family NAD(P)-dependent oxidoreductase [Mesorhizobium sp. 1B3]|uniref:SDR family NAD(P)-dependent oxidoreductase n=1 Tax=Mesorhizobium sp. 1B3 TaxID=3243599 RepID=UPI003D98F31B
MNTESNSVAASWAAAWAKGKAVCVTGGTSGIGAAIARTFVAGGANVICTGLGDADLEMASADAGLKGARLERLDVRDGGAVRKLFEGLDRLDVLVNCAGMIRRHAELEPEMFETVVDVNLNGTMRACSAARPLLAKTRGSIVNTASMLSYFGGGLVPGYSASKGGVAQLTKSLAIAYAADGIRVNAIAPGWIATALTAEIQEDPARRTAIESRTALKRWGTPEDMVGGVLYLASPLAAYVTGTILPIDGGYLAV